MLNMLGAEYWMDAPEYGAARYRDRSTGAMYNTENNNEIAAAARRRAAQPRSMRDETR
jgi:hypothetical protein